ncbi:MAG: hypothetical protein V1793_08710 [Pseudomonadota bacterium]
MESLTATLGQMAGFVPRTLLIMFCSMAIAWYVINSPLFTRVCRLSRPLTRLLKLPEAAAATSVLAFGSLVSANILLAQCYRDNLISKSQAYLGALLNGASLNVKEVFTYQIPVILPILGLKAGLLYLCCFASAAVLKWGYIMLHTHLVNSEPASVTAPAADPASQQPQSVSFRQQVRLFGRLALVYVLVTFVILFLCNHGLNLVFEALVQPINTLLGLPTVVAVPISVFIFSPIAGASALGSLISAQTVTPLDGAMAIMVGSFLLLPIFALRGSLSRHISIFGPGLGIRIVATSTGLGMLSRLVFVIILHLYKGAITL